MNFTNGGVIGADVSYYQDSAATPQQINFFKMVERGASFVIVRAGQNLWPDPDWIYNWRNAKVTGLPRGAYFFFDSRVPPEQQADLFANQVIGDLPELELWIDLEENYGGPYAGYVHWKKFLNRLRTLLPTERIGIYTSYGYIAGKIPQSEYYYFASFPLWLAWYTFDSEDNPYPIPDPQDVLNNKPWLWFYGVMTNSKGNISYMLAKGMDGVHYPVRVPLLHKYPVWLPLAWVDKLPLNFIPPNPMWRP